MAIKRKLFGELIAHLQSKEFTIITGARQIGKSTLLSQLEEDIKSKALPVIKLTLERKNILLDLNASPENIFKYIPNTVDRMYVLIDEIQLLDDPSNFLKLLYDEYAPKLKIIATGSSAFYIDQKFTDSLAGRKKLLELKTLDFEEFLLFKERDDLAIELTKLRNGSQKKSLLENQLWIEMDEYINYGGYPAITLEKDKKIKKEKLEDIRDSFVKRDILESKVKDEIKFYELMILLSSQTGNLLNQHKLSIALKVPLAAIEEYIYILQKCYHVSIIRPFYQSIKKELIKMPKIFFNDLGLRNMLINYFAPIEVRPDKGALLENYVFRRLSETNKMESIKYWRTADGSEVDFVIDNPNQQKAYEVKYANTEISPKKYSMFTDNYTDYPLQYVSWKSDALLCL